MFEDKFSEKQEDMLSLAFEYSRKVGAEVDTIFIYASFENIYAFDIFYKTRTGKIEMLHQLPTHDLSEKQLDDLIFLVLKIGTQDLQDLHSICQKYNQPMPTQIKIVYDVVNNSVDAQYSYDKFYSNSDVLTPDDIFEGWFEEIKAIEEK